MLTLSMLCLCLVAGAGFGFVAGIIFGVASSMDQNTARDELEQC